MKESSINKPELFPDIDMIDVSARQENLAVRGEPILLQMPLTPAYVTRVRIKRCSVLFICTPPRVVGAMVAGGQESGAHTVT